jgi:hypothetical protein
MSLLYLMLGGDARRMEAEGATDEIRRESGALLEEAAEIEGASRG